jgi:hypothetical protein
MDMAFRVTVSLGQGTADGSMLEISAGALQENARALPGGEGAVAAVDPVKAAVQLVVVVNDGDALAAGRRALELVEDALRDAEMPAPASILTLEAESVPPPAGDREVRLHIVHENG